MVDLLSYACFFSENGRYSTLTTQTGCGEIAYKRIYWTRHWCGVLLFRDEPSRLNGWSGQSVCSQDRAGRSSAYQVSLSEKILALLNSSQLLERSSKYLLITKCHYIKNWTLWLSQSTEKLGIGKILRCCRWQHQLFLRKSEVEYPNLDHKWKKLTLKSSRQVPASKPQALSECQLLANSFILDRHCNTLLSTFLLLR